MTYHFGLSIAVDVFPRGLKHHVGINSVLLCSRQKLSVSSTQESRLNDKVAMKSIAFNF